MGEKRVRMAWETDRPALSGPERTNAAGEATRSRIIDVAEKLFADNGVDAVSFKDIRATIGLLNNSAIQYHFGDKASIVRAILRIRYSQIERGRAALLEETIKTNNHGSVMHLMDAIYRPRCEVVDADGFNTFSKFALELRLRHTSAEGASYPVYVDTDNVLSARVIVSFLKLLNPSLSDEEAVFRLQAFGNMLDMALVERDTLRRLGKPCLSRDTVLRRILEIASSSFLSAPSAPASEDV